MQKSTVLAGLERGSGARFRILRLCASPSFLHQARNERRCGNGAETVHFSWSLGCSAPVEDQNWSVSGPVPGGGFLLFENQTLMIRGPHHGAAW
jgi:hypothetical protein